MSEKKQLTQRRQRFLEAMPAWAIEAHARTFHYGGSTTEDSIARIARDGGVFWLLASDIPIKNLKRAAEAVGISLEGLSRSSDISDHLTTVLQEWDQAYSERRPITSVSTSPEDYGTSPERHSQLLEQADRLAKPICYLKSRKSSKTTKTPVAAWNAKLSMNRMPGTWLRVDMRKHPDKRLHANGVLSVDVNPLTVEGQASFQAGTPFAIRKDERSLYAEDEWDVPCREILEAKATKAIRNGLLGESEALDEYATQWWNPTDHLTRTGIYAQLGGWPITWPEESANEQLNRHVVLRTYRDAEPWIEVSRIGRKYRVDVRIT